MSAILEDLSTLSPKKLARRLEELAKAALPCLGIFAYSASPRDGLTTALWVDSRGRRDVLDLARVVETEPGGYATVAWSRVSMRPGFSTLLLRVAFDRPVRCSFDVRIDVRDPVDEGTRGELALLLAASGFALAFGRHPDDSRDLVRIPAPVVRAPLLDEIVNE